MQRVNIANPEFEYAAGKPEGFRIGRRRLGELLGAGQLGASVYEVPPGQTMFPYHYEYGEEEWLLVLAGRPTLRHPEGTETLEPWDLVCFPRGPEGAHAIRNDSEETARVLMFSSVVLPTVSVYPDSGKVGVWTGSEDDDLVVPRDAGVDYWSGEPGTGR